MPHPKKDLTRQAPNETSRFFSKSTLASAFLSITVVLALITVGCDSDDDGDVTGPDTTPVPEDNPTFQGLYDQGVDRFLGSFGPNRSADVGGGVTTYYFETVDDGPLCFTGSEYMMSTRQSSGDVLMIFLQGGGYCAPSLCDAVETAHEGIPPFGLLNASDPANPAATFDVGYLPYCDGSTFIGDRDVDSNGDGVDDRFFRGAANLSAGLDVIATTFPSPRRILLTGNSAGGISTHYALPLVRKLYPDVPIDLVNDSGVGILSPGGQEANNSYWNSWSFFPENCATCIGDDGNLTDYQKYQLAQDADLRVGFISTKQDSVITRGFGILDPVTFETELLEAMEELRDEYPERFRSLIADGEGHTFLLRNFDGGTRDVTVREWMTDLLSLSERWISVSD